MYTGWLFFLLGELSIIKYKPIYVEMHTLVKIIPNFPELFNRGVKLVKILY